MTTKSGTHWLSDERGRTLRIGGAAPVSRTALALGEDEWAALVAFFAHDHDRDMHSARETSESDEWVVLDILEVSGASVRMAMLENEKPQLVRERHHCHHTHHCHRRHRVPDSITVNLRDMPPSVVTQPWFPRFVEAYLLVNEVRVAGWMPPRKPPTSAIPLGDLPAEHTGSEETAVTETTAYEYAYDYVETLQSPQPASKATWKHIGGRWEREERMEVDYTLSELGVMAQEGYRMADGTRGTAATAETGSTDLFGAGPQTSDGSALLNGPGPRIPAPVQTLQLRHIRSQPRLGLAQRAAALRSLPYSKVCAITALFLVLHLRGDAAALSVFALAPSTIAGDVRRARLGALIGTVQTQRLLRGLLLHLHRHRSYTLDDERVAAAGDLLVACIARTDLGGWFDPRPASIQARLEVLFEFVPLQCTDVELFAVRAGIVYGALAAYVHDRACRPAAQIIKAGLRAVGAVLTAAAYGIPFAPLSAASIKMSVNVAGQVATLLGNGVLPDKLPHTIDVVVHKFNIQVLRAAQQGVVARFRGRLGSEELDTFQRSAVAVLQMVLFSAGVRVAIDEMPAVPFGATVPGLFSGVMGLAVDDTNAFANPNTPREHPQVVQLRSPTALHTRRFSQPPSRTPHAWPASDENRRRSFAHEERGPTAPLSVRKRPIPAAHDPSAKRQCASPPAGLPRNTRPLPHMGSSLRQAGSIRTVTVASAGTASGEPSTFSLGTSVASTLGTSCEPHRVARASFR